MILFLRITISAVLVFMCYEVITTSLESNLFAQWGFLAGIPWMRATLWDFYANVLILSIWVCYKENSLPSKIIWVLLLVSLGSIATCTYLLIQLFKIKKGETVKELFFKKNQPL